MTSTPGRRGRHLLTATAVVALVSVPGAAAYATGAGNGNGHGNSNDKQTICHKTHANSHPYVINTPNKNGDVSGHAKHTGPVWTPDLKALHVHWGDIIPPFDYNDHGTAAHFPGQNWDANGQAWFANGCRVPITGTVDKLNDANGDGTFGDDETATSEGVAVPFQVTITNTSVVPAVVTSLLDTLVDGPIGFTPSPDPVGMVLAAGASATFTFTVADYSPPDGGAVVNDMAVGLAQVGDPSNHVLVHDGSTVRTAVPPAPPTGGGGGETTEPPFTGGGGGVTLPRTGAETWDVAAIGLALLLCGGGFVLLPAAARRRS
jgi:LPXTG-motif cell wall-anchored protein